MLTLHFSPTSPYVRKVMMVAIEKGVAERITQVTTNPWESSEKLLTNNPLSKVPCLVLDDGLTLFDSPVICEYLESLTETPKLFPPGGHDRWVALRQQALGDGIMDAAVLRVLEAKREAAQQSEYWKSRHKDTIHRALAHLEETVDTLVPSPTIGTLTIAAALGYLDLRHSADAWRDRYPQLAKWHQEMARRDSYKATEPPAA
jgi:glutathione S-transferase